MFIKCFLTLLLNVTKALIPRVPPCLLGSHGLPRSLTVLAERRNLSYHQINQLEVLADNVLLAAASSVARLSPVYRWRIQHVDDSGSMVIRSKKNVAEPGNTALSDGAGDARLVGLPAELLIRHKIQQVHILDSPDGTGAMDMRGEGLAEGPRFTKRIAVNNV